MSTGISDIYLAVASVDTDASRASQRAATEPRDGNTRIRQHENFCKLGIRDDEVAIARHSDSDGRQELDAWGRVVPDIKVGLRLVEYEDCVATCVCHENLTGRVDRTALRPNQLFGIVTTTCQPDNPAQ